MKVKLRRLYVALEGVDGIGKTTQIEAITNKLVSLGFPRENIIRVKEPWEGSPITKLLREEYLSGKTKTSDSVIQQLMAAARTDMFDNYLDHIEDNIEGPAYIILSDRCILSSMAYYSGPFFEIIEFNNSIINYPSTRIPDCVVLFTASRANIQARMDSRENHEIFEDVDKLMQIQINYQNACDYCRTHQKHDGLNHLYRAIEPVSTVSIDDENKSKSVEEITDEAIDVIRYIAADKGIEL